MEYDHAAFLSRLRETPGDETAWLVYADWLDERDDPTGAFVRLSLDFTLGRVRPERDDAHVTRFSELFTTAHPETRDLLAERRSRLPLRFLVGYGILIGEDPPREMFGYARTIVVGTLLTG